MTGTLTFGAHVKAVDEVAGTFSAVVSVFGNVDRVGDVVLPGAFTASLTEWAAKGALIPVIWSHQWGDIDSHIGWVTKAVETAEGLVIDGQFDMDEPRARKAHKLIKGGRVTQWSFAYNVIEGRWAEHDGKSVYELGQLDLLEVGPTLIGANSATRTLAAKSEEEIVEQVTARVLAAIGQQSGQPATSPTDPAEVSSGEPAVSADADPFVLAVRSRTAVLALEG